MSPGHKVQSTLLEMLKKGEVLPDIRVEEEVELVDQEKASTMMMVQAAPAAATAPEPAEGEVREDTGSDIRAALEERLRAAVGSDNDEEDED